MQENNNAPAPSGLWPHVRGWMKVAAAVAVPAALLVSAPGTLAFFALAGGVGGIIAVAKSDRFRASVNKSLDRWRDDFVMVGKDMAALAGKIRRSRPARAIAGSAPGRGAKRVLGPPARAFGRLFVLSDDFNRSAPPPKDGPGPQPPKNEPPPPKI